VWRGGRGVRRSAPTTGRRGSRRSSAADGLIIAPATYNTINKLALGINDTYPLNVAAEAIGRRTPVIMAPFVNTALAARRPFTTAVQQLRTRPVLRLASFHDARHRAAGTAFGTQLARADHSPPPQRLDLPEALTRQGHPVPLGHVLEHLFVHGPLPADRLAVQVAPQGRGPRHRRPRRERKRPGGRPGLALRSGRDEFRVVRRQAVHRGGRAGRPRLPDRPVRRSCRGFSQRARFLCDVRCS